MSNPFQIPFTLKQHTPIIHFQHNQEGATLRATEVKPKLDRFLIEKLDLLREIIERGETKKVPKEEYKSWFINGGKQHLALDYKIRILPSVYEKYVVANRMLNGEPSQRQVLEHENYKCVETSPYFAQEKEFGELFENTKFLNKSGKWINSFSKVADFDQKVQNLKTLGLFTYSDIPANIFCQNRQLKSELENSLFEFFLLNNFGTRQNKGFGSFMITSINSKAPLNVPALNGLFSFKSKQVNRNLEQIFKFIKDEYQLLKSGTNKPSYVKSKMFEYFINQVSPPLRWEKRYIKRFINNPTNRIDSKILYKERYKPIDIEDEHSKEYKDDIDRQANDYKFIRVLLGLAEQYEFLIEGHRGKSDNRDKYVVSVSHAPRGNQETIQRFKSPLFFKVIDGDVYLRADNSYQSLLGENFVFELELKSKDRISKTIPAIQAPSYFDINDFLSKCISQNWTDNF